MLTAHMYLLIRPMLIFYYFKGSHSKKPGKQDSKTTEYAGAEVNLLKGCTVDSWHIILDNVTGEKNSLRRSPSRAVSCQEATLKARQFILNTHSHHRYKLLLRLWRHKRFKSRWRTTWHLSTQCSKYIK